MQNKLKRVKTLLEKRNARKKEGRFVVEGPRLIEEAGNLISFIVHSENLPLVKKLAEKGVPCYKVSPKQFKELSGVETPQGILAVVRMPEYSLSQMLKGKETLIVFCDGVQDPGNLGTIIRSAAALGASGVLLSKGTVDLYNPKVVRSTMGSLFHLPIIILGDNEETLKQLRENNVKIITTTAKAKKNCFEANLSGSLALVVGNEGAGVEEKMLSTADEEVKIPIPGKAESLNVGMATSILLYEALRQRT